MFETAVLITAQVSEGLWSYLKVVNYAVWSEKLFKIIFWMLFFFQKLNDV